MSLTTVRAAIAKATKRQRNEGCGPSKVRLGESREIIAAAKADGRVSGVERKEIKSFYESRVTVNPDIHIMMTRACPETSQPTFTAPAARNMTEFLYPAGGGRMHTMAIPENP